MKATDFKLTKSRHYVRPAADAERSYESILKRGETLSAAAQEIAAQKQNARVVFICPNYAVVRLPGVPGRGEWTVWTK